MSNTPTPTPRTDKYFAARCVKDQNHWAAFARELERELANAIAERDEHDECADAWCAKARELNEQRDTLAEALREITKTGEATPVLTYQAMESIAREALAAVKGEQP
jgi:adenylyl- and sulfurtransferase ThiI